jgi:dolichol-phosphate mannosyltransferase
MSGQDGGPRLADPGRLIRFAVVGTSGVGINTLCLWLFTEVGRVHYLISSPIAIELSILSNFTLNDRWTFRDAREPAPWPRRLGRFHVTAAGGAALNWLAILLLARLGGVVHYQTANLVGIAAGFLWNYTLNVQWTWRRGRDAGAQPPR